MKNGGWAVAGQYYADMTQYTFNDGEQKDNRTLNRILKRPGHVHTVEALKIAARAWP